MEQITLKYENLDTEPYIVNSPASMHGGILYKKFSENFLHYNDKRIKISQVIDGIFNYIRQTEDPVDSHESYIVESINDINDKKYILPIAVATNPVDWSDLDIYGKLVESKKSIFEIISPLAIKDLQNEKALLLIDQSIEGYHQLWLWDWFHKKCQHYNINPKTIIYMTGDQDSIVKYDKWAAENNVSAKLKVIPSITLSSYIRISYEDNELDMKFDVASKLYAQVIASSQSPILVDEAEFTQGMAAYDSKDYAKALKIFTNISSHHANSAWDISARRMEAETLIKLGRIKEALFILDSIGTIQSNVRASIIRSGKLF